MKPLIDKVRKQFAMLIALFLLGMAVNLIGLPKEVDSSSLKTFDIIILALHVLLAIGIVVNGIMIVRLANKQDPYLLKLARSAGAGMAAAIIGGTLTAADAPGANIWSFVMATGFIWIFVMYGKLYVKSAQAQPAK